MTNYARIRCVPEISATDDYRSRLVQLLPEPSFELATPTKHFMATFMPTTAGLTIDLGMFTTILGMVIVNRSATAAEVVDATWYHIKGTKIASANHSYADNDPDEIADAGNAFLTSGAETGGYCRATGSATADHNGVFLIQSAAAGILVLPNAVAITGGADAAVAFSFERKNTQGIPANTNDGMLVVTDNVQPAGDLLLTSESGTPAVDVLVFGT